MREIQKWNPWWFDKEEKIPEYRRRVFSQVSKNLRLKQIIAIIGLRRVGKTVLMKQLLSDMLQDTKAGNILFFSFEERWRDTGTMEDILYHFLENVASDGRKHIFLDEIQKVDGWEDVLKRFYDRYEDIKFIISGSASIRISRSIESLAGRLFDFYLPPLSFLEFLELNGVSIRSQGSIFDYASIEQVYTGNLHQKEKLSALFDEYLFKGGFPEISGERDEEVIRKYIINSVIEKILSKDLPEEFEIKKLGALREMLEYVARETSGLFVTDKLASLLGLDKVTASNYMEYLKRAFLIHMIYNHTRSKAKQIRTSRKLHIVLPSVAIAMEAHGREVLRYPEVIGKYVESAIAVFLSYKYNRIWFWRTPQKDEVDIVVEERGKTLPIEVKYRTQIGDDDIAGLLKFCKRFGLKNGIVVAKDRLEKRTVKGIEVMYVPAWLLMLEEPGWQLPEHA